MSTDIRRLKFNITNLVNEMLDTLPSTIWSSTSTTFLDPEMGGGQFIVGIIQRLRVAGHSDANISGRVHGITSSHIALNYVINRHTLIGQFRVDEDFGMKKFDVIIGNPPYQTETDGNSRPIWHKFVLNAFDICEDGGYVVMVHPSGWRDIPGHLIGLRSSHVEEAHDLLYSKQLKYLEIHNEKDGLKMFGAETRYDWYCVKNSANNGKLTHVKFEDGSEMKIDITSMSFIPNHSYKKIAKLIAKPGEDVIEILHSWSAYEYRTRNCKSYIHETKTKKFKYPVVYTVNGNSQLKFKWSSSNQEGHFGIPKFIWSNGRISSIGSYVDLKGKYGLTQFAYAIVDTPANLKRIKKAFDSIEFRQLMEACATGQLSVNYKIVSMFRKDFWRDFV